MGIMEAMGMMVLLARMACAGPARPQNLPAEPVEIIQKAVEANEANWKVARNYTWTERDEKRGLDVHGGVKRIAVHTLRIHAPDLRNLFFLDASSFREYICRKVTAQIRLAPQFSAYQMSRQYSLMVRSEENIPIRATFEWTCGSIHPCCCKPR